MYWQIWLARSHMWWPWGMVWLFLLVRHLSSDGILAIFFSLPKPIWSGRKIKALFALEDWSNLTSGQLIFRFDRIAADGTKGIFDWRFILPQNPHWLTTVNSVGALAELCVLNSRWKMFWKNKELLPKTRADRDNNANWYSSHGRARSPFLSLFF